MTSADWKFDRYEEGLEVAREAEQNALAAGADENAAYQARCRASHEYNTKKIDHEHAAWLRDREARLAQDRCLYTK